MDNLTLVLRHQGKYEEAEALAGSEKELGESHPSTPGSLYCLAYPLHIQDQYQEVLQLYNRAVQGYLEVLGSSHPHAQACQSNKQRLLRDMQSSQNR